MEFRALSFGWLFFLNFRNFGFTKIQIFERDAEGEQSMDFPVRNRGEQKISERPNGNFRQERNFEEKKAISESKEHPIIFERIKIESDRSQTESFSLSAGEQDVACCSRSGKHVTVRSFEENIEENTFLTVGLSTRKDDSLRFFFGWKSNFELKI